MQSTEEKLRTLADDKGWKASTIRNEIENQTGLSLVTRTVSRWLNDEHKIRKSYRNIIAKFIDNNN